MDGSMLVRLALFVGGTFVLILALVIIITLVQGSYTREQSKQAIEEDLRHPYWHKKFRDFLTWGARVRIGGRYIRFRTYWTEDVLANNHEGRRLRAQMRRIRRTR